MLKRIYVDNYKTLVNFTLDLGALNLLLGPNGAGKSATFEVIQILQRFIGGSGRVTDLFSPANLTIWEARRIQNFEMSFEDAGDIYRYELAIEHHDSEKPKARVKHERLLFADKLLLAFEEGEVQLFRDNYSKGPAYPFDWSQSAVASINPRNDNTKLSRFRERMASLIVVHPIPILAGSDSPEEVSLPSYSMDNFVSWYRYLSQDQGFAFRLTGTLREILPGFTHFKFEKTGEYNRSLKVSFSVGKDEHAVEYRFGDLSDGQRMLIMLYTLLHLPDSKLKPILCIDEPENFVGLQEIQPWLSAIWERCDENTLQTLLISHHPESINYLLASPIGYWFDRPDNSLTRMRPFRFESSNVTLSASELIARGWLSGE